MIARRRVALGFACGAAVVWLAQPSWRSLAGGAAAAAAGEALRIWASGHLSKGQEVTRSGPYRFTRHPLYAGSFLLGIALCIAAERRAVTVIVLLYCGVTIAAAIRTEEAALEQRFGEEYSAYRSGELVDTRRRFSLHRMLANREQRAILGLLVVSGILVLKVLLN